MKGLVRSCSASPIALFQSHCIGKIINDLFLDFNLLYNILPHLSVGLASVLSYTVCYTESLGHFPFR